LKIQNTSATINWLNEEKTGLIIKVPEYWQWAEMKTWLKKVGEVLEQHPHEMTLVIDFQSSTFVPNNAMLQTQKILENRHPKADPIILTGVSLGHKAILETLFKLHPHVATPMVIIDNIYELIS